MKLPNVLVRNLRNIHAHADAWLANLDAHIQQCEARWHVRVTGLVPDLSYNVVAFAEGSNGVPYVLKLSPPHSEFRQEIAALKLYDGDGICRVIHADDAVSVMLLERLVPGVSLWRTDVENAQEDDLATRTAAALMKQLWRPVSEPHPFRTLQSWSCALPKYLKTYPKGGGPLPHLLLEKAHDLLTSLLADSGEPVLLHADLHHGNIVSATRQPYLAIDPKGILGPRGYDAGSFLVNPKPLIQTIERSKLRAVSRRRVAIFSEMLTMSPQEVAAWGLIHAALEMCWNFADHGEGWERSIEVGAILGELL